MTTLDRTKLPPGFEDSWDGPHGGPQAAVEGYGCRVDRYTSHIHGGPWQGQRSEADVIKEAWEIYDGITAPAVEDAYERVFDRLIQTGHNGCIESALFLKRIFLTKATDHDEKTNRSPQET